MSPPAPARTTRLLTLELVLAVLLCGLLGGCTPKAETVSPAEARITRPGATALVVVFSRSGYTAQAGKALAAELAADFVRLVGRPEDGDTLLTRPSSDELMVITPAQIELSPYGLVLLGTPIWHGAPTAYINTFVKRQRLDHKRVVLFFTFEGSVDEEALSAWRELVARQGGQVVDLFSIDRDELGEGESVAQRAVAEARARRQRWTSTGAEPAAATR